VEARPDRGDVVGRVTALDRVELEREAGANNASETIERTRRTSRRNVPERASLQTRPC
jgi:hypothetical protein